jgi:RNA polymerase sigma-70 factor (ECF subfamily)
LAEDLVQDTFLAALQCCDRFGGQSSERTWLTGILKHKAIDHYRRQRRYDQLDDEHNLIAGDNPLGCCRKSPCKALETMFSSLQENAADPATAFEASVFWSVFERCLSSLPPRIGCAFVLREIEGLEPEMICRQMNISERNLWVMIYRARTCLRRCLQANWLNSRK